jgi:hypothetical protein
MFTWHFKIPKSDYDAEETLHDIDTFFRTRFEEVEILEVSYRDHGGLE